MVGDDLDTTVYVGALSPSPGAHKPERGFQGAPARSAQADARPHRLAGRSCAEEMGASRPQSDRR